MIILGLEVNLLPLGHWSNVSSSNGVYGFPALGFGPKSGVRKPANQLISKLSGDFSIIAVVRPNKTSGGFLFAFVNPSNSIIQFGLELSESMHVHSVPSTDLIVYYTDDHTSQISNVIGVFTVPEMIRMWTLIVIKFQNDSVSLYLNCSLHKEVKSAKKRIPELSFEEGSTFYAGQSGLTENKHFEVGHVN